MGIIVFCQILKSKNHLKTSRHRLQKISKKLGLPYLFQQLHCLFTFSFPFFRCRDGKHMRRIGENKRTLDSGAMYKTPPLIQLPLELRGWDYLHSRLYDVLPIVLLKGSAKNPRRLEAKRHFLVFASEPFGSPKRIWHWRLESNDRGLVPLFWCFLDSYYPLLGYKRF